MNALRSRTWVRGAFVLAVGLVLWVPIVVTDDCGEACEPRDRHPFFDGGDGFLVVSHEGNKDVTGSISLEGFIDAADAGARVMETNLVLHEGELVAWHGPGTPGPTAPRAADLLTNDELADVRWMFEFNSPGAGVVALADLLETVGRPQSDICIQFGSALGAEVDRAYEAIASRLPDVCTCASTVARVRNSDFPLARFVAQRLWPEGDHGFDCAVVDGGFADPRDPDDYPEGVVRLVWFIRPARPSVEDIIRVICTGFDGVMTDDVTSAVIAREMLAAARDHGASSDAVCP